MDRQVALRIIYDAIDIVNGLRAADDQVAKLPDVVLLGEDGILDSLALTTLVLAIERMVEMQAGNSIALMASPSLDENMSGLRTPASIAELILEQVGE